MRSIREGDLAEFHLLLNWRDVFCVGFLRDVRRSIDDLEDTVGTRKRLLQLDEHVGDGFDRRIKAGQNHKVDQELRRAHGGRIGLQDKVATHAKHGRHRDGGGDFHEWFTEQAEFFPADLPLRHLPAQLGKLLDFALLAGERLHDHQALQRFLRVVQQARIFFLILAPHRAQPLPDVGNRQHNHGHPRHHDQCQLPVQNHQGDEKKQRREGLEHHIAHRVREDLLHRAHVIVQPGDQAPAGHLVEGRQVQRHATRIEMRAQPNRRQIERLLQPIL